MAEQALLVNLLGTAGTPTRTSKSKKKRTTKSKDQSNDTIKPLGSGSYSSQFRRRRDALLYELDVYSQLSLARLRRRRMLPIEGRPIQTRDDGTRGSTLLAAEMKVISGKKSPPSKLRTHSSRGQDSVLACGSSKPYNESKLIGEEGGELVINSTTAGVEQMLQERLTGSTKIKAKEFRKISDGPELLSNPYRPDVPDAFADGYRFEASSNKINADQMLNSTGGSAVGKKRISLADKLNITKGGSVIRIKSMSEKRHNPYPQSNYDCRLANYKQFVSLVLHCNAVYVDWVFPVMLEHRERRVEIFVGQGNNSNLIKKVIKKRWWLQLGEAVTANTQFVWTQIKHKNFVMSQRSRVFYQANESFPVEGASENINGELARVMHPLELARQKQPVLCYKDIVKRKQPARLLNPIQRVHNHLQFSGFIGNKKSLLNCLMNYYRFNKTPLNEYSIPLTYYVSENAPEREFSSFREVFLERQRIGDTNNTWIVKPGQNSNRGHGIIVSSSLQDIADKVKEGRHSHVIQQYISAPLLYQRRKFDIRVYCLVTQVNGVLRAYWYQEGYIRTSAQLFRLDCLTDPMIHLTNDAVQKHGPNYGKYEPANKVAFEQFQQYLKANGCPEQRMLHYLVSEMKRIVTEVIRASYYLLDPNCRENNFELFGVDFLVDSAMRLWLLEFNTNPCLQLCSPVLIRLLPKLIDNVMSLAVDPLLPMPPNKNRQYFPDTNLQTNRFELIFDSTFDRNQPYQQFLQRQMKSSPQPTEERE